MILSKDRIKFNVNDKSDINMYANFLKTGSWGATGCPFALEYPYVSVPDMIKDKLIRKFLGVDTI
jgi:hypothetical protein